MRSSLSRLAALAVAGSMCVDSAAASVTHAPPFQTDQAADDAALFVRAKEVWVRPGKRLENAAVLIEGGRIRGVGSNLEQPEGARLLEAEVVTAGFIDPWSALGVDGSDIADDSATAATRTVDAVDPYAPDHALRQALAAGITAVRVQAGAKSQIAGQGSILRPLPGAGLDELVVVEDACVAINVAGNGDVFQRIEALERALSAVESGAKYRESWAKYEKELAEWETAIAEKEEELEKDFKKAKKDRDKDIEKAKDKGKEHKEKKYKEDSKPKMPRFDENAEIMGRVADGELPLVVEVRRAPELRACLKRLGDFNRLRPILAGADDAAQMADEIAAADIPVLIRPEPRRDSNDPHDLGLGLAAELQAAGVTVLFGAGGSDPAVSSDLPLLAALAIGHGLDRDAALAALTTAPARAFDVADRMGSVARGRQADLVLWSGDPFESSTRATHVIAAGEVVIEP